MNGNVQNFLKKSPSISFMYIRQSFDLDTGEFSKGFGRCRLSCMCAEGQLRRQLPNPFREFPCVGDNITTR